MVTIVLHCSDSRYGNTALITKWHVLPRDKVVQRGRVYQGNGWSSIGYHFVILNGWLDRTHFNMKYNGHVETGRPLDEDHKISADERGAHVRSFNKNSIGICLIGKSGEFTDEQLYSTLKVVYSLEKQFFSIEILQHSDLDPQKPYCAGLDMDLFKRNYEIFLEERPYFGLE